MTTARDRLRVAAERLLCEAAGAERVVRLCPHCGSADHGPPRLIGSDLAASIAYGGDLAAVAWGAGPLGIDIEDARRPGLAERLRGLGVPDLLAWTRTEALAKAAGTGLRDWPDVTLPDLPTTMLSLPDGFVGTLAGEPAGWSVART